MLHRDAVIADYGPAFAGFALKVDGTIVCVVPPQLNSRPEVAVSMRQQVRELGGDCGECRNCPIGRPG
ncbi:hypothetical protein ACWGNN_00565 [Streptomyces sp. NPDC055817]